ncbi:hypothetical protein NDU88_005021 [Pleurodeles waltl]|uniref:Uncharacterized protein n=1 Tax=Pleurodeles waltl TaxID=8319 RepID=A0AAV7MV58_PLEWA|nr:hypothetical protein NDU88_005021 [Pleurodeles waltl]
MKGAPGVKRQVEAVRAVIGGLFHTKGTMETQRQSKKEGNSKELFMETLAKNRSKTRGWHQKAKAPAEELDHHRQELLTLQESNLELQYRLQDLENMSRRSNIRIRGVSMQATPESLEDFVIRLLRHITPAFKDQEIILDLTHKVGQPSRGPGQAQDRQRTNPDGIP